MKQIFLIIWLLMLLNCAVGQGGIHALQQKDTVVVKGETYAIIVGISAYPYIKPLQYADKDAELFKDFLLSKAGGLVKPENITLLTNKDATSGNFQTAFQKLYNNKNVKNGDRVYIYFAGHGDGIQDLNEYYLLLYDCQPAGDANNYSASLSAIDMYHLKNRIGKLTKSGVEVVLILDACRTNELPGGYSSQVFNGNVTESKVGEIMMLATGPGEVSIESPAIGSGHGLFTYELIDGLSGRADSEDGGDNNGQVSLAEIQDWVRRNVRNVAQKQFHTQQNPFFCCSEKENIEIARVDSIFLHQWLLVKDDYSKYLSSVASRTVQSQRNNGGNFDSIETQLFNHFNNAVKDYNLYGSGSASSYYDSLLQKFPASSVTENAKYVLAGELINFSQKKINLYLNGKDNDNAIDVLKKELLTPGAAAFARENFYKDSVLIATDFFTTGLMMQKAADLLSVDDTSLIVQVKPKINFLYARSFYDDEKKEKNIAFKQALQFAYAAFNADPNAAYINHVLSLLYQKNNQLDSALYFERRAITLAPKWAYAYNHLGFVFYKAGNNDSAWKYYKKALDVDSAYLDPYLNLSIIASEEGADKQHNKYYQQYLKLPALAPAKLILYGNVLYDMKKYEAAIWFFKHVLQIMPNNTDAYFNIANSFSRVSGKINEARINYEKVIRLDPSFSEAYLNLGNIYYDENNTVKAKSYYSKALETNGNNAKASFNIGNIYLANKQYDSACIFYKKTIQIEPAYSDAYLNAGNTLFYLKKYDSALLYYKKATAMNAHYINAYINSGDIYKTLNNGDSSVYYYKKAIEMQPVVVIPHNKLHETLPPEIDIAPPNNLLAFSNLGSEYLNLGKPDSAIVYFKQALAIDPACGDCYASMGDYFLAQKQYDSSMVYYKKAVEINNSDSSSFYNIACIYSRQKDGSNALLFLEKALKAGFTDKNQVMTDEDLDYIRNTDGFKKLMEKYFKK